MAEHGVLKLELGHASASGDRSDQPDEYEVDEGSHRGGMLPTRNPAEPSFWTPTPSWK